jgi:predicted nucleic acid-binding protein
MEGAVLIDAAIALYALGEPGPARDRSRALIDELAVGRGRAYASVEMVQEVVHHRLRRTGDRARAVRESGFVTAAMVILDFDREVLDFSLDLIARVPAIRGRGAVHAATALAYGIEVIASPDRAFDGIPGLRRIDPLAERRAFGARRDGPASEE